MESAKNCSKSSSTNIFHRFIKLCRLQPVGVFTSSATSGNTAEESDRSSSECDNQKIHPQPPESDEDAAAVLSKLFTTISDLKSAYIDLQQAHIPYDREKLHAADQAVVSNLNFFSEIKQKFPPKVLPLVAEVDVQKKLVEQLQLEAESKDEEIVRLKRELEDIERRNAELAEKREESLSMESDDLLFRELTPNLFAELREKAAKSIHDFAKPLIALMKASGWNLDEAASSVESSVVYAKRFHKKYAFDAYLCRKMFDHGRPNYHQFDHLGRLRDPLVALISDPDSEFGIFCRSKYLTVVHPAMERSFFGNLDHRAFVRSGGHPRTLFYHVFVKMCKWVWVLMSAAGSMSPRAEMFGVSKGSVFSKAYMENVADEAADGGEARRKVGLMVMPGFKVGGIVMKCTVYLSS